MELTQTQQPLSRKDYKSAGNYDEFLQAVRATFEERLSLYGNKLFRTHNGALDSSPYNTLYIDGIGEHGDDEKQHYNCRCCRRFMNHFADLVFVDGDGKAVSAFWDVNTVPEFFKPAVAAMQAKVERSAVQAVFVPSQRELGIAFAGNFNHFAVVVPEFMVWNRKDMDAHEKEALFAQDFEVLEQSLKDYPVEVVRKAKALLNTPAAFRGEKADGPIAYFLEVAEKAAELKGTDRRNYIWSKIAYAPSGFAKPRSTVISIVLDGIKEGRDANLVLKSFNKEMDPIKYQRGEEEEVKKGQIDAAERLVEKLELATALARRAARVEELPMKFWSPKAAVEAAPVKPASIFDALRKETTDKSTDLSGTVIQGGRITWAKFKDTVLPSAESIKAYIPNAKLGIRNYITAVDPEANRLWRWESDEARCPFSSYLYQHGSDPRHYNLQLDSWVDVTAIVPMPWHMGTGGESFGLNEGACFILQGAWDTREPGTAIFAENLRTELHPVGNVIAALGAKTPLAECDLGTAAGIDIGELGGGIQVKVNNGVLVTSYIIDRWN